MCKIMERVHKEVGENNKQDFDYMLRRSEIHFFQHLNKVSPDFCGYVALASLYGIV